MDMYNELIDKLCAKSPDKSSNKLAATSLTPWHMMMLKIHSLTTETMKPIRKDSRRHYPLLLTSRLSYQLFPHCLVQLLFSWMDLTSSHITPAKHSFIAFWTLFNPAELAVTLNAVLPS